MATTTQKTDLTPVYIIGGGLLGYEFVLKPILETLQIKDTDKEIADAKYEAELAEKYGGSGNKPISDNPWNPNYVQYLIKYGEPGTFIKLFKVADLAALDKKIYGASGGSFFGDKEQQLFGALRTIETKSGLSQLAGYFETEHNQDLYEFIVDMLNDPWDPSSELRTVHEIVSGYKTGIIDKNGKLT